jgi:SNF2 family DNA or RNA helicase
MLVIEKYKSLALKLNNPSRVLETIPTAQRLYVKDEMLVTVPHTLDEVRILRNLGISAPSPILHYYDWSGRYKPYEHQRNTAAFLTVHPKALVLNDLGTGKSLSALWAADYLIELEQIRKVLIVSPLSTLERVWGDAIFADFPHRRAVVLHGTAQRRSKLLKTNADFYIINHDGFTIMAPQLVGMFDLIIVDEAAVLRNPSSQRFKTFRKFVDKDPNLWLWLMTGTPTPNEPTDAWALAQLVNSPVCPKSFTAFRDQVMMKFGMWKWIPRPASTDIVRHVLQPAVRYTREECLDLPDTVYQTRKVELTPDQKKHYTTMMRHLIAEVANEGTITALNESVKVQKLNQLALGVAYGEDGECIELDCKPRIDAVKEVIKEAGGKVIVFVPLTGTLRMLERELSKHWTVGVVNGGVPAGERNKIFHGFQNGSDPQIIIAHPATMAHGLTLTAASTIVWYGPINSNEQYVQANGRVERIGKRMASNVVHIEATELERKMYQRLKNKQALQGLLLELIRQETVRHES